MREEDAASGYCAAQECQWQLHNIIGAVSMLNGKTEKEGKMAAGEGHYYLKRQVVVVPYIIKREKKKRRRRKRKRKRKRKDSRCKAKAICNLDCQNDVSGTCRPKHKSPC